MTSRDYFKGKRVAVIGLGAHGEMIADIKYLIKSGALVSVYDLRSEASIKSDLVFLRSIGLANYVCSSIPAEDLLDMDLIILSEEYPRDSTFLKEPKEKKIPIEYVQTLFFKLAPPITLVGVMGACGKSTVVSMLTPLLEFACENHDSQGFFVLDSESGDGALMHLKKVKNGDIVLMKITENMLKELHDMRISPHVAIFTTLPETKAYDETPLDILLFQTYNNFIIASDEVIDATHTMKVQTKAKMLRTKNSIIPADWEFHGNKSHDRDNAALALQAARLFKVSDEDSRRILENWKSLRGRIEFVKKVKNIEFYNDSASVSPLSTLIALQTIGSKENTILIFGGVDSGYSYKLFYNNLPKYVHTVILIPGSGTLKERNNIRELIDVNVVSASSLEESVKISIDNAKKGDKVLFSPGFDAGGFDRSRKERGERFVRTVRSL